MSSFEPIELRVIGVLVAFDIQRNPLMEIDCLLSVIEHVIVVDNAPDGHPVLVSMADNPMVSIIVNRNIGGLAGAYNAALSRIETEHSQATHVLFLDDDTDTGTMGAFLGSGITREAALRRGVAAVAPAYIDRETGLRGTHIKLRAFSYDVLPRQLQRPTSVSFLINSMSLWSLAAIRQIGPYSTRLKVDHVDTDYCLRAAAKGFELILNPQVAFLHSIGKRKKYRFLGKTLQSGGHSPLRREAIACNTIVLGKHYIFKFPSFSILCLVRVVYEILGIILVENNRWRKLLAVTKGIVAGTLTPYA